jgi:hypothetical protein
MTISTTGIIKSGDKFTIVVDRAPDGKIIKPECIGKNRPVADETASADDFAVGVDRRYRMTGGQRNDLRILLE